MKSIICCKPRESVLDGSEDFVVNLAKLPDLTQAEALEFLDSNVLTSGMEELVMQAFDRLSGCPSRGIFKLSESMGGGKTQSMIVAGLLAKHPEMVKNLPFQKKPKKVAPDAVVAFSGRSTDENVWVTIGAALGATFASDKAPSEKQWVEVLKDRSVLILLDELSFYLVHAASAGKRDEGERFSQLTAIAMTNLFGAVRDYKECGRAAVVVADLQKDWDQGHEDLARIMRSNVNLGGTIQSADNEMSKGAVTISPVDNTKDELYAILRKRLFKAIDLSEKDKKALINGYFDELSTAKKAGLVERALPTIQEELEVSYPFHFSTKHLIETFNDNPGFQKTRDVIRLMAAMIRSIWGKGDAEVRRHTLLSLASADLNDSAVAARFKEIKRPLEGALMTDIANGGSSFAESLADETDGLSLPVAKWIYAASLSEARPRGLAREELAEYLAAPGTDLSGLTHALDELSRNCWYLDQLRSGRFFFNKVKNLNAQVNSYVKICSDPDRDRVIDEKLKGMFEPRDRRCYEKAFIHPDLSKVTLNRDRCSLVVCHTDAPFREFFEKEKYKNRVVFLTQLDPAGLQRIRNHARRLWAIRQVLKDMTPEDQQWQKAKDEATQIETELFLAIRSVYARLLYPLGDPASGDTRLEETTLLDSYQEEDGGQSIKYEDKNAPKGEFVVETTLRSVRKFIVINTSGGATERVKAYRSLRTRVEHFLFPSSKRAAWDQILDSAGSRGIMVWAEPGTMEKMKDALLSAGEWREEAGQVLIPPFEEVTGVQVEHTRDKKTGRITTTDIKLFHADTLEVSEDGGAFRKIPHEEAFTSDAMTLVFQAKDATGKNKPGKPYRIENHIDLKHDFLPSSKEGHRILKIGVVPKDADVKWTADGSDPANNGAAYADPGIEAAEGARVKLYAEKGTIHTELTVPIPRKKKDDESAVELDPEKPATIRGGPLCRDMGLATRLAVHQFLSGLPKSCELVGPRARAVKAETDSRVAVSWDNKTRLSPDHVLKAYAFLDGELDDADWALDISELHFATGKELLDWQAAKGVKIEPSLITQ